ncbi:MAG TPA: hypothetical protein VEU09_00075 [Candidatus Binatia bacterium]|nr:hypothetical protein [Candidatus Binatia bacterium]
MRRKLSQVEFEQSAATGFVVDAVNGPPPQAAVGAPGDIVPLPGVAA